MNLELMRLLGLAVVALGALVTGAVVSVIRLHALALRRAPSGTGILSWHVVMISAAHLCYVVGTALGVLDLLELLETPVEVRLGLYVLGSVLTLAALYVVGRGQHHRVRRANAQDAVTPLDFTPRAHRRRGRPHESGGE